MPMQKHRERFGSSTTWMLPELYDEVWENFEGLFLEDTPEPLTTISMGVPLLKADLFELRLTLRGFSHLLITKDKHDRRHDSPQVNSTNHNRNEESHSWSPTDWSSHRRMCLGYCLRLGSAWADCSRRALLRYHYSILWRSVIDRGLWSQRKGSISGLHLVACDDETTLSHVSRLVEGLNFDHLSFAVARLDNLHMWANYLRNQKDYSAGNSCAKLSRRTTLAGSTSPGARTSLRIQVSHHAWYYIDGRGPRSLQLTHSPLLIDHPLPFTRHRMKGTGCDYMAI